MKKYYRQYKYHYYNYNYKYKMQYNIHKCSFGLENDENLVICRNWGFPLEKLSFIILRIFYFIYFVF